MKLVVATHKPTSLSHTSLIHSHILTIDRITDLTLAQAAIKRELKRLYSELPDDTKINSYLRLMK